MDKGNENSHLGMTEEFDIEEWEYIEQRNAALEQVDTGIENTTKEIMEEVYDFGFSNGAKHKASLSDEGKEDKEKEAPITLKWLRENAGKTVEEVDWAMEAARAVSKSCNFGEGSISIFEACNFPVMCRDRVLCLASLYNVEEKVIESCSGLSVEN